MKKLSLLFLIFVASATFAQTDAKLTHPKVKEYTLIVNDYVTYKKSGKKEPYKDLLKVSNLADEINCLLTIEQAKKAIPFFKFRLTKLTGKFVLYAWFNEYKLKLQTLR